MRGWTRLIKWAQEERTSAGVYAAAVTRDDLVPGGAAALWGDPELELGLRWRRENRPTAAWAKRFDDKFDRAMEFLDRSERERARERAERRAEAPPAPAVIAWGVASVLLVMLVIAVWQRVGSPPGRRGGRRRNFGLATKAVDELLVSVEKNQASVGADVPQMEQFRRELLERAQGFYAEFIEQQPTNEQLLEETGLAHFRLGHIYRMLDDSAKAASEYRSSIARFEGLSAIIRRPGLQTRRLPMRTTGWLRRFDLWRPTTRKPEAMYGKALALQRELMQKFSSERTYQQELARTRYNRGILYAAARIARPQLVRTCGSRLSRGHPAARGCGGRSA